MGLPSESLLPMSLSRRFRLPDAGLTANVVVGSADCELPAVVKAAVSGAGALKGASACEPSEAAGDLGPVVITWLGTGVHDSTCIHTINRFIHPAANQMINEALLNQIT